MDASPALIDARGADALTMRNVADVLGCSQASLYRHVRNREELVTLLADRAVSAASSVPPDSLDWAGQAAWSARLFGAHLRRYPGLVPLLRGTERLGPNSLAGLEYAVGLFTGAGLSPRPASAADCFINSQAQDRAPFGSGAGSDVPTVAKRLGSLAWASADSGIR